LKFLDVAFFEDVVGGFGPHEGPIVPAVDECADGGGEFTYAAEGAAVNGLAFDDGKPHLDQVEPGCGGRGEVGVDAGVGG
jgi:hypothetical protein